MVVGLLVLVGWEFDIVVLKSIIPNIKSMNPLAAACFLLLGVSLLIHHFSYHTLRFSIATACAGLALLVALSRLWDICFGFGFSVDRLLFRAKLGDNHMAASTAFIFLLLSVVLLTWRYPKKMIRHILIILVIIASIICLVAYLYRGWALYQTPGVIDIALNAAITFFIFSCGVLCFEPDYGLMGILTDEGISGVMARQLLSRTLVALIAVGWLRLLGQQLGLYDLQMGILVHLFLLIGVFVVLIWVCALVLRRVDNERKEKEEKFLQLSAIVESSKDAIIGKSLEGTITSWNKSAEKLYGYTAAEVIGKSIAILMPPDHTDEMSSILDQIKRNEPIQHHEAVRQCKNGRLVDVSLSISPVKDLDGRIIGAATIARDITQFKIQRERVLQLSRAVENSPLSIVITDHNGTIEYVNPKFVDLTGYSLSETIGQNPRILKSGEQSREFYKNLWDTIKKGDEWHGEFHNKKKNGELYWESASISPLKGPNGHITHFVAVKENITLRKEQEEKILEKTRELEISNQELENKNKQLKQLDQLKDEFVNNVSHELRTPLTIIQGGISLITDGLLGEINEDQKKHLNLTLENIDRLGKIINDLLDISTIENKKLKLYKKIVNMNALAQEVVANFIPQFEKKGLAIQCVFPQERVDVLVDKDKMVQVLVNLIGNAYKFTDKGTIEVSVIKNNNTVECCVKDTGIGIAAQDIPRLFSKFDQIGRKPTEGPPGTGLGLSIAKGIIEAHEGHIKVESSQGKGTKFIFTLPECAFPEGDFAHLIMGLSECMGKYNCFSVVGFKIKNINGEPNEAFNGLASVIKQFLHRQSDQVVLDKKGVYIVLPDIEKEYAGVVAQRVRQAIEGNNQLEKLVDFKGFDIPIVNYPQDGRTEDELVVKLEIKKENI
jgi:PAS domain S-box-containing protein